MLLLTDILENSNTLKSYLLVNHLDDAFIHLLDYKDTDKKDDENHKGYSCFD